MPLRLRFLVDTNILIPLQDSHVSLKESLKNVIRLSGVGGHQILYHPASEVDIKRDRNVERRERTLSRLAQYQRLDSLPPCPWNEGVTHPNEVCDNEILYALKCNAVHALITEDKGIHAKAKAHELADRVYNIQTAEDWLRRLHEPSKVRLPNIEDLNLYTITPELSGRFFDSLRGDYQGFDGWFKNKAQEGRRAWICRDDEGTLGAICIYAIQEDEQINDQGEKLQGMSLKLCTFKVDEPVRGRKIGELFLKAAFRFATDNKCAHIFVHGNADKQPYLAKLLEDFGFFPHGNYGVDVVWVKEHPVEAPIKAIGALEYARRYFPHFRQDKEVGKYLVPIQPRYHEILFPELKKQLDMLDSPQQYVGNAIKLAYLCHTPTTTVVSGDILVFYRTGDEMACTTIAIVDNFRVMDDPSDIAALVSRRTVYSVADIENMVRNNVKVILFRLIRHFHTPVSFEDMKYNGIISGSIQSFIKLNEERYKLLASAAGI